jgi:predicted DNA-binding antitoxin AbrB/MazE fold protein
MTTTVEAIYEDGVLKLSRPIGLADGTLVEVTVTPRAPQPDSRAAARALAELAALPVEATDTTGRVGRDHDKYLYGGSESR